jgi:uncharacterized Fe-S radical SAM superfamily protein PflX
MWWSQKPDVINVINDQKVKNTLTRYFEVVQRRKLAKYLLAGSFPADFSENDSTYDLWGKHEILMGDFDYFQAQLDARARFELYSQLRVKRNGYFLIILSVTLRQLISYL